MNLLLPFAAGARALSGSARHRLLDTHRKEWAGCRRWRPWRLKTILSATTLGGLLSGCTLLNSHALPASQPMAPISATEDSAAQWAPADSIAGPGVEGPVGVVVQAQRMDGALAIMPIDPLSNLAALGAPRSSEPLRPESSSRLASPADLTATPTPTPTATPSPADPTATPTPTPTATPSPTVPAPAKPFSYTVASGDTLSSIAAKFGISVRTVARANGIADPAVLAVGRTLTILPTSGTLHTVVQGDTILTLANRFYVIPEEIVAVNGLAEPYSIRSGDVLIIPETEEGEPDAAVAGQAALVRGKQEYDVVPGDSLASIAARFGLTVAALAAENGLDPAKPLAIGRHLVIPPVGATDYVVQKGDTVAAIAAQFGASAMAIIKVNSLVDPYILIPGQHLLVPGDTAVAQPTPTATATSIPTTTPTPTRVPPTPAASIGATSYQVVAGDTLTKIAARFGVTLQALVSANNIDPAKPLAVGLQLKIPGAASPTAKATATVPAVPTPAPTATKTPAPAPAPAPTATPQPTLPPVNRATVGGKAVEIAMKLLGTRYTWGGTTPQTGFDCSGFVMYVFRQAGLPLPRDLWGQLNMGSKVDKAALQPGDLVFFQNTYKAGLSHNGIYVGSGQFIHAASEKTGVIVSKLDSAYWASHFLAASRPY